MSRAAAPPSLLLVLLIAQACATEPKSATKETHPEAASTTVTKASPSGQQMAQHPDFFEDQNLKKFVGRTVGDWVAAAPVKYQSAYPIDEPPGKLKGFAFEFPDGVKVDVLCRDLKHVKKFNADREWKLEEFLLETISEISVRKP